MALQLPRSPGPWHVDCTTTLVNPISTKANTEDIESMTSGPRTPGIVLVFAWACLAQLAATPARAQMQVKSGSYVGDGVDNRPIFVGLHPDVVFVDRYDPANPGTNDEAVLCTSTMPAGMSKFVDGGAGIPLSSNGIKSLDAQGFTVGTDNNVNQSGLTYYWVAFTAAAGQLVLGTYTGTGAVQDVTSVGFSPAYLLAVSEGPENMIQKSSAMPASFSMDFTANGFTDAVQSFLPTGFQVGTNAITNTNGIVHHYLAWAAVPGKVAVGSYTGGSPTDNRDITGTGFWPEWVIVSRSSNVAGGQVNSPVHKPASTGVSVDNALLLDGALAEADNIQNLNANGFQVGSHTRVNSGSAPNTYHWVAFGPHLPQTNLRSIGTAPDDTTGTLTATNGSPIVSGSGTSWLTNNRGRGDVITICDDPPGCSSNTNYVVASVSSDTSLQLTTSYAGATGSGKTFSVKRQFATLAAWEDCVDGPPGTACPYFPVSSSSLVSDNRREIGIVYKEGSPYTFPALGQNILNIAGATTGPQNDITLTVDPPNRHNGTAGTGVVLDNGANTNDAVLIEDEYVTVEWLEIKGGGASEDGIQIPDTAALTLPNKQIVRFCLIHNVGKDGIQIQDFNSTVDLYNNVFYGSQVGIALNPFTQAFPVGTSQRIFNNTVFGCSNSGIVSQGIALVNPTVTLRNNIAHSNASSNFNVDAAAIDPASSNNLASDTSGTTHSPGGGGINSVPLSGVGGVNFKNTGSGTEDLHLTTVAPLSRAQDAGANLSSFLQQDIDGALRVTPWDIGADDVDATTVVKLVSFAAAPEDGAVALSWETASELDNLGFHLYRATAAEGPYERITGSPIPGLGSSPVGARYSYLDQGLRNGVTYYYRLEDIDTSGATEMHGPVSATPVADAAPSGTAPSTTLITYGEPAGNTLRLLQRGPYEMVLELTTAGFYAEPREDGSVSITIPDFAPLDEPDSPAIPVKRSWVDAVAGRKVTLLSILERDVQSFTSLRPSDAGITEVVATPEGTVRLRQSDEGRARRARLRATKAFREMGLYPSSAARIVNVGFQGEEKKALVELAPIRWDAASGRLLLARHLLVRLSFAEREPAEQTTEGDRGRRYSRRASHDRTTVAVRLRTTERGLYSVRYEDVMNGHRGPAVKALRLSRQGEAVAYHLEPNGKPFGPGSVLYFVSEGASANPYGAEAVYELELGRSGEAMETTSAAPAGEPVDLYLHRDTREENRYYQAALVDAPDIWLWDLLFAPQLKSYSFEVSALASSAPETSRLSVWLQGTSDLPANPDHHVRMYVNGSLVAERSWDGKKASDVEVELATGLLHEGENQLEIENVGDTEAAYSMVMPDRYEVQYPRLAQADEGRLEGLWSRSGTAELTGLADGAHVLDVSEAKPRWLLDTEVGADGRLRFHTEAGRSYLAVSPQAVHRPIVTTPMASRLKDTGNRADYLVIGPEAFLRAAKPLMELRKSEGLEVAEASIEEIYSEFGFGESTPVAVKDFLSYAYHKWRRPSPRYVLLLGDATYDFKDYLGTGVVNQVPPLMVKTPYLWTVSDPSYAAVNGEDPLPDFAIGRLPASTVDEVESVVEKIVAYETGDADLRQGAVVLVADNPDRAGDFEADADDLAETVLATRHPEEIFLSRLGAAATRNAILKTFDDGASLVNYLGHGGIQLWAEEDLFDSSDLGSLGPQSREPLVLTMSCLNGYFDFPYFDSLAEELVLAKDKGAIAAISPSGLSLDGPAHLFHRELLEAIFEQHLPRLGDAVLAAQSAYAATGVYPGLLTIYQLLGDPALTLK